MALNQLHFEEFSCQSNIHGHTWLADEDCSWSGKLLISQIKGRIVCCAYNNTCSSGSCDMQFVSRDVVFEELVGKGQILAIDCFQSKHNGNVIGITTCNDSKDCCLHIFSRFTLPSFKSESPKEHTSFQWHGDDDTAQFFPLPYVPNQLTHCPLQTSGLENSSDNTAFILLGCDNACHIFCDENQDGIFIELDAKDHFPELMSLNYLPIFVEIKCIQKTRLTAIGFENGLINLMHVDIKSKTILRKHIYMHDSPISSMSLFNFPCKSNNDIHLLVAVSRSDSVLYASVQKNGFLVPVILNESSKYDVVTCCAVNYEHFAKKLKVLIGTFGKRTLVYQCDASLDHSMHSHSQSKTTVLKPTQTFDFSHPVMGIKFGDLTGDGLNEMTVISTKGMHIFQYEPSSLTKSTIYKEVLPSSNP